MGKDKITELRIEGLRTIERLSVKLSGHTVLLGENGSGKSSILEACELLRRAAGPNFYSELHGIHGGLFNLLRDGASDLSIGVSVEGEQGDPPLRYDITLSQVGAFTRISREQLELGPYPEKKVPLILISRTTDEAKIYKPGGLQTIEIDSTQLVLPSTTGPFSPHPGISRMKRALEQIETHLPFEVLPLWAAQAHKRRSEARGSLLLQRADRLERLAGNLANVYHTLRTEFGEGHWQTTMDYVRLGLGEHIDSVNPRADLGGGAIALALKIKDRDIQRPASALSDGELAYLAFVALYRLRSPRALLTFDEPELHLHPGLLVRVSEFFDIMAEDHPVLIATHSDRLLDTLQTPTDSVRVCELEGRERATRIHKLDADALKAWLDEYTGVGALRSAGYLHAVMKPEEIE